MNLLLLALGFMVAIADGDTCDPACAKLLLGTYGRHNGRRNSFNFDSFNFNFNSLSMYQQPQQQAFYGAYQPQQYRGPMSYFARYYINGVYCRKGQITEDLVFGNRACYCGKHRQHDDEEADNYDPDCLPDPYEFRFVRRCKSKTKSEDLPGRLVCKCDSDHSRDNCNEPTSPQCAALMDLYDAADGDTWVNNANWGTGDCCDNSWYGVTCLSGSVTELNLGGNLLSGSIPDSMGSLTALAVIALESNLLSGSIPDSMGSLTALEQLYLGGNLLSGSIPNVIGDLTALTKLALGYNQLSGSIPDSICKLTALDVIALESNQLSGTIPDSIGDLTALEQLDLFENSLSGSIPDSIKGLTALTLIKVYDNKLTAVGASWDEPPGLNGSQCDFSDNSFGCPIPAWTKSKCSALCGS